MMSVNYEYAPEANINPNLICSICSLPFNEPHSTPCDHTFCRTCIMTWLRSSNWSCPLCREALSSNVLTPATRLLTNMLNQLSVNCLTCNQTGLQRGQYPAHVRNECQANRLRGNYSNVTRITPIPAVNSQVLNLNTHNVIDMFRRLFSLSLLQSGTRASICSNDGCLVDHGTERCTRCQNIFCGQHRTQHQQRCGNQRQYDWILTLFFVLIVVLGLPTYVFTTRSSTKRNMKIEETPPENDARTQPVSCTSTTQCSGQQFLFENSSLLTSESQNHLNHFYERGTSNLLKWELIYRGSIHGLNATAFHTRCDNKGETFTVLSSTRGYLVDGYTDANWNTSAGGLPMYGRSKKAFLFSLVSPQNLSARKFPLNTRYAQYSIVNDFLSGPIFGGTMRPDIGIHESNG